MPLEYTIDLSVYIGIMPLAPAPWGLVFHGYLGTVFFSNNYLAPYFLFAFIHFALIWMTQGLVCQDIETQYRYALDQLLYFFGGTLLGIGVVLVTGQRPLIPGDTWRSSGSGTMEIMKYWRSMPQFALLWNTYAAQLLMRSIVYIAGLHQSCYPFYPPPDDDAIMVGWWVSVVIASLMLIASFTLTFYADKLPAFWRAFAFTYEDDFQNAYIVFYLVAFIILNAIQAIWNFLVLPPNSVTFWIAGTVTAASAALIWTVVYILGAGWLRLDSTHFGPVHSRASWGEFCAIAGGIHVLGHIWYIVGGKLGSTRDDFNVALYTYLGACILLLVGGYFVVLGGHRVRFKSR